jgi:RNA binding exosome subunit
MGPTGFSSRADQVKVAAYTQQAETNCPVATQVDENLLYSLFEKRAMVLGEVKIVSLQDCHITAGD